MKTNLLAHEFRTSVGADAFANRNVQFPFLDKQSCLVGARLRYLPMSATAQDAKNKDLEVVLSNIAVLGYN